ncbi:MAG: carboxypeptidase-like regulatory domain-containing protein [Planctomycetota bacterium]
MFDLTIPYRSGRLHIVRRLEECANCDARDSHARPRPSSLVLDAIRLDREVEGALRALIASTCSESEVGRSTLDSTRAQLAQAIAAGQLLAIECGQRRVMHDPPPGGSSPSSSPGARGAAIHIGGALEQFVECDRESSHSVFRFDAVASSAQFLAAHFQDERQFAVLRRAVVAHSVRGRELGVAAPAAIFAAAAALLVDGGLRAIACRAAPRPTFSIAPPLPTAVAPVARTPLTRVAAPAPTSVEKTWIELRLVRKSDGAPVPGARYRLKLPAGTIRTGRLEADGTARINGIDPGTCEVTFLDFDEREWRSI